MGERAVWIDVARGASVIAVVLLHVRIFVYDPLIPAAVDGDGWRRFTEFFGPFRLPLLFTIAGLLVSERVRGGWRDRRTLLRVVSLYWMYAVWLAVFAIMSAVVPATGVPFKIETPGEFVSQLVLPDTPLWFVFALAVYVVVLTTLDRVPRAAVLAGFAAVAVLSGLAPASEAEAQWLHIVYYGVFFAAGVQLPAVVRWFAGGHVLRKAGVALAVFVGALLVWQLTQIGDVAETSARLVRDVAAVALAVTACALLCRLPRLTRPLAAVGRQTLPIYILQLPAIWLLYLLPVTEELHRSEFVWFTGPLIGTAVVVALSLACYAVMQRTVLRNLFRLPSAWSDRLVTPGRRRDAPSGRSSGP